MGSNLRGLREKRLRTGHYQEWRGCLIFSLPLTPPRMCFPNSGACHPFKEFIKDRICNGSINVVGCVGEVNPPHLVMPITVEPSKPRMCHDERFINCWIKDCPFKLDYLTDLCRYVDHGHYQTTFDDKSGYDHIRLHPRSFTFFGFQWEGWYFTYACLPFGWKASAFVYNTVSLTATHCIRSLGVPCSQYIDDRQSDNYVCVLGPIACALSPTFSWLKWQLSLPVPWFFPSGTSLTSRKVV